MYQLDSAHDNRLPYSSIRLNEPAIMVGLSSGVYVIEQCGVEILKEDCFRKGSITCMVLAGPCRYTGQKCRRAP